MTNQRSAGPERASSFSHDQEVARPSYYKVHLDNWNATAEMTATERAARFRFTYEQDGDGYVVLDVAPAANSSVQIIPGENKITAISRNHDSNGSLPKDGSFANYIVLAFDRPFAGLRGLRRAARPRRSRRRPGSAAR